MNQIQKETIACALPSSELAARQNGDIATLLGHVVNMTEQEDGIRFEFSGEDTIFNQITNFIAAERQCCSFFRFELSVSPEKGPIFLTLGGSPEIKAYVKAMLPEVANVPV